MSDTIWQPEHPAGHQPFCVHPYHSLSTYCAASPAEPATMNGQPSRAWLRDHEQETTMSAQRYADPVARQRMAAGNCPECGNPADAHDSWGGPGCSLTGNGAAERIAQYRADEDRDRLNEQRIALARTIADQAQAIADGTVTGPQHAAARRVLANAEMLMAWTADDRI